MSTEASDGELTPKGPRRHPKKANDSHASGPRPLNESEGKLLFHIVRVCRTNHLATHTQISASIQNCQEAEPGNFLQESMILPTAAELQRRSWTEGAPTYVKSYGKKGYKIEAAHYITNDRTARIVMELVNTGHVRQILRSEFEAQFADRFQTRLEEVESAVNWLIGLRYVEVHPAFQNIYGGERVTIEMEFIKRLADQVQPVETVTGEIKKVARESPGSGGESSADDLNVLALLTKKPFYSYHLTQDADHGKPMWSFKILHFEPIDGVLRAKTALMRRVGGERDRQPYEYEATMDHGHLLIRGHRSGMSDDITIQMFPWDSLGEQNYPWCGVGIISRTWHSNPATTISLLTDTPLPWLTNVADGDPIDDPSIMKRLEMEWKSSAERIHLVNLPLERAGAEGIVIYPNWDHFGELLGSIQRGSESETEDLRIATIAFTSGGAPEDKLLDLARNGIRIRILLTNPNTCPALVFARNRLRATSEKGDGETPKASLKALSDQIRRLRERRESIDELKTKAGCQGLLDFRLSEVMPYAFVAHSSEFIVLGLFLATGSYGGGPMIVVDRSTNRAFWEALHTEWVERWKDAKLFEVSDLAVEYAHDPAKVFQQVFTDTHLLKQVEAKVADGANVWIAAYNLSNVGDESNFSASVREVVQENAKRNVTYTYICPTGQAGESRMEKLRECFQGKEDQLRIHSVPPEHFSEITLIRSNFITFNAQEKPARVYMQLPLPTAEKGWVLMDQTSAKAVFRKMENLIQDFPAE